MISKLEFYEKYFLVDGKHVEARDADKRWFKIHDLLEERASVIKKMGEGSMGSRRHPTARNYTQDLRKIGTKLEKLGYKDW